MRAISKVSYSFYINGELNDSIDALALLAISGGIFNDGSDGLSILFSYANASPDDCMIDEDQVESAIEQMIDNAIAFILMYPDLEYAENTIDIRSEKQLELIERAIAANNLMAAFNVHQVQVQKTSTPIKQPLQEINISTPRTANHGKMLADDTKKETKIGFV